MLNTIKVKNFQSIDKAEVQLGRFTVFTGPSSSGKSALVRATQAIARNSFTPSQVSQWAKESKVTLEFDDHTVSAERGKSKSTYFLDDEVFTKAGRAVPDKVAEALRLPEISETESTFATQFDKPYLIADPGSVAAKVLGSLTNVSILHNSLRESNRRSLDAKSKLKVRLADITEYEESLSEFEGLEKAREAVDGLAVEVTALERMSADLKKLQGYITKVESLAHKIEDVSRTVVDLSQVEKTVSKLPDTEEIMSLSRSLTKVVSLHSEMSEVTHVSVPDVDTDQFDSLVQLVTRLEESLSKISSTGEKLAEAGRNLTTIVESISKMNAEYDKLLIDVDVCPLCGSTVNGELHV